MEANSHVKSENGLSRDSFPRVCDKVDPGVNPGDHTMSGSFRSYDFQGLSVCDGSVGRLISREASAHVTMGEPMRRDWITTALHDGSCVLTKRCALSACGSRR